ncbi:MAG: alcohol dehydrogenase catalytic domain-containing protein [Acidobacteria bacterium]|nr:alcohol dehydrogenase catalytic domain-containing protein [Acidobacteriota bacterium]MBI3423973.1 alcohol dehydrogenase catalytic domain-containing protein [Acidobacteriota bacterium]
MKALRFEQGAVTLADVALPPARGEALVRVTLAGICNTDVEIVRGYANFSGTLGHEFVGVVADSPDRTQIGQRVVGEINAGCGVCAGCREHDARHCARRTVLGIRGRDGAFAEYLSLPPQNLLRVPDSIPDRAAVFTEPLAAACAILEQVPLDATQRVAVIGDGKLGQLIARVLATTGCELILIGKHADKLELAAQAGIHTVTLSALRVEPRFDLVVEASGSAIGLQLALELVRPRGTIVLKSTFHGEITLDTSRLVVNEIKLRGSRCGRFAPALALLSDRRANVEPLIAREFALTDGVAALQEAQRPGVLKVLLRP